MTAGATVNALTVDFEDWYQGLEIPIERWGAFEDRLTAATHRLLDVFDQHRAHATFFVLGHVAERHPGLVREIAARGHELATHGYSHTLVYRLSPGEYREELVRSIGLLEESSGTKVLGHRAPFFSVTRESLWVLDLLLDLGLRYDSSIHPVQNYRYGIEDAPRWPHPVERAGRTLTEFPITTVRVLGKNIPVAGGAYFRIYPYALTRAAFRSVNAAGHPAVFYVHPWELDPEHPRIPLPRRIAATHYVNLGATERRLHRLLRDFRFAPMGEVLGVA
jgi:polysaccharide deacetylase family protein (PEP-CTERM system associated)